MKMILVAAVGYTHPVDGRVIDTCKSDEAARRHLDHLLFNGREDAELLTVAHYGELTGAVECDICFATGLGILQVVGDLLACSSCRKTRKLVPVA